MSCPDQKTDIGNQSYDNKSFSCEITIDSNQTESISNNQIDNEIIEMKAVEYTNIDSTATKLTNQNNEEHTNKDEQDTNLLFEFVSLVKFNFNKLWRKFYSKKLINSGVVILFAIYFCTGMYLNNPFKFPANTNSSVILKDYIFSNNKGILFPFKLIN